MTTANLDVYSPKQLNYLLLLNTLLEQVEPLRNILAECQHEVFQNIKTTIDSQIFTNIQDLIGNFIRPGARFAKNMAGITERCFAIKSGINGLLDLVRKMYSERLNDMTGILKKNINFGVNRIF